MELAEKKLNLIERLMRVEHYETLAEIEELLKRAEIQFRVEESLKAIENNDVMDLETFTEKNKEWLKNKTSK